MKNITVSVGDELYRRARSAVAARHVSVSALVRDFFATLPADQEQFELLKRQEREILASITDFSGSDRLSRDEVHERDRS